MILVQSVNQSSGTSDGMGTAYEIEGNSPCKSNCRQYNRNTWSASIWYTWSTSEHLSDPPSLAIGGDICSRYLSIDSLVSTDNQRSDNCHRKLWKIHLPVAVCPPSERLAYHFHMVPLDEGCMIILSPWMDAQMTVIEQGLQQALL